MEVTVSGNSCYLFLLDETPYGKRLFDAMKQRIPTEVKTILISRREVWDALIPAISQETEFIYLLGFLSGFSEEDLPDRLNLFRLTDHPAEQVNEIFRYRSVSSMVEKIFAEVARHRRSVGRSFWWESSGSDKLLCFTSIGDDNGTTACAVAAANAFARKGKRVLFLDAGIPGLLDGFPEIHPAEGKEPQIVTVESGLQVLCYPENTVFQKSILETIHPKEWDKIVIDLPIHFLLDEDFTDIPIVYVCHRTDRNMDRFRSWWKIRRAQTQGQTEKEWLLYNYNVMEGERLHLPGLRVLGAVTQENLLRVLEDCEFWNYLL